MKTAILLKDLKFRAFHGVMPQEQSVGNEFMVNVKVYYPFEDAICSDSLAGTISYAEIYEVIRGQMAIPSALLEHVAGRIRNAIVERFPEITSGVVTIEKMNPPITGFYGSAAVEIEW